MTYTTECDFEITEALDTLGHFIDFTGEYLEKLDSEDFDTIEHLDKGVAEKIQVALKLLEEAHVACDDLMDQHPDHVVTY